MIRVIRFDLFIQSSYSFNGSLLDIDKLILRAKEWGYTTLALTDQTNLHGAVKFYQGCVKHGIKPIIGLSVSINSPSYGSVPMLLYAKNNEGYRHLIEISSLLNTEEKELSYESLSSRNKGLIAVAMIHKGYLYSELGNDHFANVTEFCETFNRLFDSFYLGIDMTDIATQLKLGTLASTLWDSIIINQVNYLSVDDRYASDILARILNDEVLSEESIFTEASTHHALRKPEELTQLNSDFYKEITRTEALIESIQWTMEFGSYHLPLYPVMESETAESYLSKLANKGLKRRFQMMKQPLFTFDHYQSRLNFELDVIHKMGFDDYFLIVWDFILYAKKSGILVGPGRGSSAGSLVSYALGIVDVDPLEHHLFFERFLNPERITMPDIDLDFPDDERDNVIQYVLDKYGKDRVCNIVAFGTFQGKSAIRDAARILGVEAMIVDQLTSDVNQTDNSLSRFIEENPDKYAFYNENPVIQTLLDVSLRIEGLPRHRSTHAAGIMITDQPMIHYAPVSNGLMGMYQTQYEATDLEALGLLKIDFLGIRNLSMIAKTLKNIESETSVKIDLYKLPMNDEKTFQLLRNVHTLGIFQLESPGMMNLMRRMQIQSFDDIAVCIALFRPGPMENIPLFLKRRADPSSVRYLHPELIPILKDTHGIIVYQEQIMQIANQFAGYTYGEADVLRRAVSKKKEDVLIKERQTFIEKAKAMGRDEAISDEIYDYIVKFANYGFNKSHSVVYALVAYWMAYLKANYPDYFMGALLDNAIGSSTATNLYIKESQKLNLSILPPLINQSQKYYHKEETGIRYPYLGIRGIGPVIAEKLSEMTIDAPITSFLDFMRRSKGINTKAVESLIQVGVFDGFPQTKKTLIQNITQVMNFIEFNDASHDDLFLYLEGEEYSHHELMKFEKELLGINLRYHVLSPYRDWIKSHQYHTPSDLEETIMGSINLVGVLSRLKTIKTKRNETMAFVDIEDAFSTLEGVLFVDGYRAYSTILKTGEPYLFTGHIEERNERRQLIIDTVQAIKEELS